MSKISNPTKVITGVNTRWSYANVWDAKSINGGAPKYSVSLIIPKSDTVTVRVNLTTRQAKFYLSYVQKHLKDLWQFLLNKLLQRSFI